MAHQRENGTRTPDIDPLEEARSRSPSVSAGRTARRAVLATQENCRQPASGLLNPMDRDRPESAEPSDLARRLRYRGHGSMGPRNLAGSRRGAPSMRNERPRYAGLFQCAREDSNLHGPYSPQGPQPWTGRVGASAGSGSSRFEGSVDGMEALDGVDVAAGVATRRAIGNARMTVMARCGHRLRVVGARSTPVRHD